MPPVSELNDAFVRPAFPEQVTLAYLQGSLVFDWIESEWDLEAIRAFLTGYGEGLTTAELADRVLGLTPAEMDGAFDRHVRRRFEREFASTADGLEALPRPGALPGGRGDDVETLRSAVRQRPGDVEARLRLARALVAAERLDEAEQEAHEALRLFPTYAGPGGAWPLLAAVHEQRGELRPAAEALRAAALLDESAVDLSLPFIVRVGGQRAFDGGKGRSAVERFIPGAEALGDDVDLHIGKLLIGAVSKSDIYDGQVLEQVPVGICLFHSGRKIG